MVVATIQVTVSAVLSARMEIPVTVWLPVYGQLAEVPFPVEVRLPSTYHLYLYMTVSQRVFIFQEPVWPAANDDVPHMACEAGSTTPMMLR